jgi:hypothetical protein
MLRPLGVTCAGSDPGPERGKPRRGVLEAAGEVLPIVVQHLIEELLDLDSGE